jgi:Protein of unknown function (DUF2752)
MEKDRGAATAMMPRRLQGAMWAGATFAILAVVYAFPPDKYSFYPRCPFYAVTHLLCPGCGGTRALYEMLHLNLAGALHYNALVTVLAPMVLVWLAWSCYQALRYDRSLEIPWPRTMALSLGVASVLFAVIRDTGIAFTI